MMEQWNDVQEKRGSDAEHRNQDISSNREPDNLSNYDVKGGKKV